MFCRQCGAQVNPGSKFCAKCGTPVAMASGEVNVATSSIQSQTGSNETVVWVLNAHRKESFLKRIPGSIVFMPDKLIVAHLTQQRQKEENLRISSEIKAEGKGFFKGSAAMMQYWANYPQKYYSMPSAQILAEDPTNFAVPYANLKRVVFQCESTYTDSDGSTSGHQGKFVISLLDGTKIEFTHACSHSGATRKTMTDLFGVKLKYRR